MNFSVIDILIGGCIVFALLSGAWMVFRSRKFMRGIFSISGALCLLAFSLWTPRAISHFIGVDMAEAWRRAPEIADIAIADSCNLFSLFGDNSPPRAFAFAGDYFGPSIGALAHLPAAGNDDEKDLVVFWSWPAGVFGYDIFEPDSVTVFADGEEIKAESGRAWHEGESAVWVMEKITDARQARLVFVHEDQTAEIKLSEGDLCRFRKLRDLWRENTGAES